MSRESQPWLPEMVDVNAFIGGYPWRHIPHPEPEILVRVMDREGISKAWVGHLPSAFHRDPTHGNEELLSVLAPFKVKLAAAPVVRPDWPRWEKTLDELVSAGVAAVRAYPQLWAMAPGDPRLAELARRCAERNIPLLLTVRFEDMRQRHPMDQTPDLSAAHVRELARAHTGAQLVVTAAGRELIEEVHWGLTPSERHGVSWDISWIWGPPTDDLSHLLRTVGREHFVLGTMWPLRLAQVARANIALAVE